MCTGERFLCGLQARMTEYIKSIQYNVWNSYSGIPFYSLLFIAVFRWEFFEWPQQICSLWAIVSHPALFLMEYSMLIKVPSSCFGIVVYGLSNLVKLHTPSSIIYICQSGWVKSLSFIGKKMSALKIFGCIRTNEFQWRLWADAVPQSECSHHYHWACFTSSISRTSLQGSLHQKH